MHASSTTYKHLLQVYLVLQIVMPQHAHRTTAKKKGVRGWGRAADCNCDGVGDGDGAATKGLTMDGFSMVNAQPLRMALDLAAQVTRVCYNFVKEPPAGECKWRRVATTLG